MKIELSEKKVLGLTVLEALVAFCMLMVLAVLILSALQGRRYPRRPRIQCVNNLKQIGLAFQIWAGDNGDKYSMSVAVTNGGTMELVGSGDVWRQFETMSNELNTPKILFCPADTDSRRRMATIWNGPNATSSELIRFCGDTNTSYFIGVHATDTSPAMFLSGDRNLTVDGVPLKPGLHAVGTNQVVGWTKEMHVNQGNVLMADSSVRAFNQSNLQQALTATGVATNRLAVP